MSGIPTFFREIRAQRALRAALRHHEILPERPACLDGELPPAFEPLAPLLARRGIRGLYSHQARAIRLLERGEDVVLATPTASGKTLVYNLPVLRRALEDPLARALFLFPLKALARDQRQQLEQDIESLGRKALNALEYYASKKSGREEP